MTAQERLAVEAPLTGALTRNDACLREAGQTRLEDVERLMARTLERQVVESHVRMALMNRFTLVGFSSIALSLLMHNLVNGYAITTSE